MGNQLSLPWWVFGVLVKLFVRCGTLLQATFCAITLAKNFSKGPGS